MAVGVDDTDSRSLGMCTTYLSVLIAEKLTEAGLDFGFYDFPNLIRLNPQVPNKTRGNGALALKLFLQDGRPDRVFDLCKEVIEENAIFADSATHPGLAMIGGQDPSPSLTAFYHRCLHRVVGKQEALEIARREGIRVAAYKRGYGVIGAIAALGADLTSDQTFETVAYRDPSERAKFRPIDESLVLKVDAEILDTFYNYDYLNHRVCIVPRSPCPVHFGVRAETPSGSQAGYMMLDGGMAPTAITFRTNQHTDAHIERLESLAHLRPRSSVAVIGRVAADPRTIPGGHVIFTIADQGGQVDCAAYEPTKQFRAIVRKLMPGDLLEAYGSVREGQSSHGPTINLEKLRVVSLRRTTSVNPLCPRCGSRLTSMGSNAGFKCRKKGCHFRDPSLRKSEQPLERSLKEGFYEPPPVAWRHLYKPLHRAIGQPRHHWAVGSSSGPA